MNDLSPAWTVGQAVYFCYVPHGYLNPATGEVFERSPEIPATVLAVAHNFDYDIEIAPGCFLPRLLRSEPVGFYYFVEIDQEEAALLGLKLFYPQPPTSLGESEPLTSEVVTQKQITGGRIAF